MFKSHLLAAAAFAVIALSAAPSSATPTLQMQLNVTGGPGSGIITDSTNTGHLSFNGSLGNFTINATTGTGIGSDNPGAESMIDLLSLNIAPSAAGTITIMLTETGLTGSGLPTGFLSNIGGTLGARSAGVSVLSFDAYIDADNTAFAQTTLVASHSFSGAGGTAFSNSASGVAVTSALFSETIVVTLQAAPGAATSFDGFMTTVPEPGALLPLCFGMTALGFAARRRLTGG